MKMRYSILYFDVMGNIIMQCGETENSLYFDKWGIAFIGEQVDDRTTESSVFCRKQANITSTISYNPNSSEISVNNTDRIYVDNFPNYIKSNYDLSKNIIIDSTSINVAVFLILIQALYDSGTKKVDVLYLQPRHYHNTNKSKWERRSFDLSKQFDGFIGIPGQSLYLSRRDKVVFLCGYESERIERSFEELNIDENRVYLLFGTPPYEAGWDMNAFSSHLGIIEQKGIHNNIYYCGAANPYSVMGKLDLIYSGLDTEEKLFLVPVGTKPMAIGACAFKVSKNDSSRISVLYDHPHVSKGRSMDIAMWNLYNIEF